MYIYQPGRSLKRVKSPPARGLPLESFSSSCVKRGKRHDAESRPDFQNFGPVSFLGVAELKIRVDMLLGGCNKGLKLTSGSTNTRLGRVEILEVWTHSWLQGYLAHKKQPPSPRTTIGP